MSVREYLQCKIPILNGKWLFKTYGRRREMLQCVRQFCGKIMILNPYPANVENMVSS